MLDWPGQEVPILTSNKEALPTPSRLESAILALEDRGDLRSLIGFMDSWSIVGEPTPRARLAEARAFLGLCMVDRAWIRLKEILHSEPEHVEALKLTAQMFLKRGWTNRARQPIEKALRLAPQDEELQALWDLAAEPPTDVEPDDDQDVPPRVLLARAEQLLCHGNLLKGQSLLERLKRDHPELDRVDDLLWVLRGDFSIPGSLHELANRYGPDLSALADLSEEADHTESVTKEEDIEPPARPEAEGRSFPALFREGTDETSYTEAWEDPHVDVTRSTSHADLEGMRKSVQAARTSAGFVTGDQDTQIRRVIRRDDDQIEVERVGRIHVEQTLLDDSRFDLDAFRREMGMTPPGLPPSDLDDPLEEEDDDLIILTKREQALDKSTPLLDPDPTSEHIPHPDAKRFLQEAERLKRLEEEEWRRRREQDGLEETPNLSDTRSPPKTKRRRRARRALDSLPVWLVVIGGLLLLAAAFLAVLLAVQILAA